LRTWSVLVVATILGMALTLTACGEERLLSAVSFSSEFITPNADGDADVLRITYNLSRSADVSIYFEGADGNRYYFRDHVYHGPSVEEPYQVLFSGVVDGYTLPGDEFEGFTAEKRVLQDGVYTWVVEAADTGGVTERSTGTLTVTDADAALPELRGFSIYPPLFTPNRDGISDRATINVDLKKDVDELTVYLEGGDGVRHHVEWKEKLAPLNQAGWHEFDYDAGVDHGADPPPDGTYTVTMRARDAVGQWTVATGTLTIQDGGVPRAYILNGDVEWSGGDGPRVSIPLGGTSGPPPGTVYTSTDNYATLGEYQQSGVFRVGIHCETSPTDHPWRWAIGGLDDLADVTDGVNTYHYLPAGERATVTGGIRFVNVVEARNPQYCYASLIHEDVEISMVNFRVDPVYLFIETP